MQGVMIVYAIFAGIVILIFVIIAVATIVLWLVERTRRRASGSNDRDKVDGAASRSGNRRLRV